MLAIASQVFARRLRDSEGIRSADSLIYVALHSSTFAETTDMLTIERERIFKDAILAIVVGLDGSAVDRPYLCLAALNSARANDLRAKVSCNLVWSALNLL